MAGAKDSIFREKLTPYIQRQVDELIDQYGTGSSQVLALRKQYVKTEQESATSDVDRLRHYQSEVHVEFEGKPLRGVERLYRRTILIEPSTVCAAHCRWCLRGQYPMYSLKEDEIVNFARYCGSAGVRDDLREVLITGGDPFMVPTKLELIFSEIKKHAPNIRIFRIGTRVPVQDPARVDADLLAVLRSAAPVKVEIGTHINHPVELTQQARDAYKAIYGEVFKIYDQTVLLKGVNDDAATLSELYDELRYIGIEAHYLFHCIPMRGMAHHRTTVQRGLDLETKLVNSGAFSGRSKPMFTLMTDLGKITPYHGAILEKNKNNEILIQSQYRVEDFKRRNPSWQIPAAASEDKNGFLRVWYPDGVDD